MAKEQKKTSSSAPESDLPEGFEPLGFVTCDGWYVVGEENNGNPLQGTYLESFTVDGQFGKKVVHKIRLTAAGTLATIESNEVVPMQVGQVIGVDEKGWLKKLAGIEPGREVFLRCTGKGTAKKGMNAPWTFAVGVSKKLPF